MKFEFQQNGIPYSREKEYKIPFKHIFLPRKFNADFVVYSKIILEVKGASAIVDDNIKQTLNYLTVSKLKLGIIVNFGESSLKYKRVVF